ncbi:MAG TPA: hypothetical protein VMZ52_00385 [Bryobacteraceae bacterium]|nr:hypothetical protein [Bryobacteraceae bacterium]
MATVFNPKDFGRSIEDLLALDGDGYRLMPLSGGECSSPAARDQLRAQPASTLFPSACAPKAALAGLWLYFSCHSDAHEVAQDVKTADGSFWHGIVHRQEPDAANSAYWFRQVGLHPIFPALRDETLKIQRRYSSAKQLPLTNVWDPLAFVTYCDLARVRPGSAEEAFAMEVQLAEWQLLFSYCAGPKA